MYSPLLPVLLRVSVLLRLCDYYHWSKAQARWWMDPWARSKVANETGAGPKRRTARLAWPGALEEKKLPPPLEPWDSIRSRP